MALPITPRLDNLAAMQTRPLGTNTAMYRDPSTEAMTRQYNQQRSDYNMARRLLRRQARRGSSEAAMGLIDLGKDANKENVTFGMQNPDQRGAEIVRRVSDTQQATIDANQAAAKVRNENGLPSQTAVAPTTSTGTALSSGRRPVDLPESAAGMGTVDTYDGERTLSTDLGQRAAYALGRLRDNDGTAQADANLDLEREEGSDKQENKFRQGLDRALGMAQTQEEIDELGQVASGAGIAPEAFNRRATWWTKNRR